MRDDFLQYEPEPSSQRSVTEWLMKVISEKKGVEAGHMNGHAEADSRVADDTRSAVAVAEPPGEPEPAADAAVQNHAPTGRDAVFTAEDLCGPPIIKYIEPIREETAAQDEILAADLCWVPPGREMKPELNGAANGMVASVAEPKGIRPMGAVGEPEADAWANEPPEHVVTAMDITRNGVLKAGEVAEVMKFFRSAEAVAEPQREVTAADVTRDRVLAAEQLQATATAAPDFPVAMVAEAAPVEEIAVGQSEVIAAVAGPAPIEGSAAATDSMFAREGIWGDQARVAGEESAAKVDGEPLLQEEEPAVREPKKGFLTPEELKEIDESSPEGWASAWKTLLRLGSVLPHLSRGRNGLEEGAGGELEAALTHEGRHEIANLRMVQYEIRSTVHDHSLQLKRMEEQLTRVRESVESDSKDNTEVVESARSTVKMVRLMGIGLGTLLVVLIVMVGLVLGHGR